ncbi:MAG: FtsX-like permease family protein [Oscillospiraceae bacterium]|nr:FtsX-like permease family protein [Oscillospiraceae bacterium]
MFRNIISLAFQGVRRRKRQSLLIFFVLLISFTFAIILLSYTSSVAETNSQLRQDTYGYWYGAITNGVESDKEYLESTEWIDEVGTSIYYGSASIIVKEAKYGTLYDIGTVDDSFIDMGIFLKSGSFPEKSGEIAIESATLSEIGFGVGSSITLQFEFSNEAGDTAVVEKTFKICGSISEYTGLWDIDCSLNTAFITEEAIAEIIAQAEEELGESVSMSTETVYFFSVKSGMESGVEKEVNSYLYENREGSTFRTVTLNSVLEMESEAAQTNMVYLGLILAITILAVVMIYILQMQSEVRRIVRFRSIGGSKGQLRLLILTETLMLAIPAMILGIGLGFFGTKLLLSLSVYSGSVDVIVSIPWNYLLMALAFWIVGILAVRMITFQIALATPLTGRMGMQRSKSRLVVGFRKALIMVMATLLCISAVFTTANLAEPLSEYNYWASQWSYYISESDGTNVRSDYSIPDLSLYEDELLAIEGVTDFVGFNDFFALVTSDEEGVDNAVVITMDWDDLGRFMDTSGIDRQAYESGESVIVQIASDMLDGYSDVIETYDSSTDEIIQMEITKYSNPISVIPEENTDITISIDYEYFSDYSDSYVNSHIIGPNLDESIFESSGLVNVDVNVGCVQLVESDELLVSLLQYDRSERYSLENYNYFVICALPVLQEIVDQIPEGEQWWIECERFLRGQQVVGYNQAFIYTNMNAGDLGVDTAISKIISQIVYKAVATFRIVDIKYFQIYNFREINYASAQVYQQSVIMTMISGVCIALVVLLILVSTLRLETESEKKRYGILQAIGMSKRQRNLELARRAIIRSVISMAVAVVSYLSYYLVINISVIAEGTSPLAVLGTMFTTLAGYGLTVPVLLGILAVVFLITFAICFGSKLGINKYKIMEMLRNE